MAEFGKGAPTFLPAKSVAPHRDTDLPENAREKLDPKWISRIGSFVRRIGEYKQILMLS